MPTLSNLLKRFSTSQLLIGFFALVILTGSLLLYLPICNNGNVAYIDALFTATTSVCVTGLMTTVAASDFNVLGQFVIMILIQIGGLGIMAFAAIIIAKLKKMNFKEKEFVKDISGQDSNITIRKRLYQIIIFVFVFEFIGFIIFLFRFFDGSLYSIFQSLFLSVSAFCNAGIDIFGSTSLANFTGDYLVNITVSSLIIIGGLGFIVWFDLYEQVKIIKEKKLKVKTLFNRLTLHTKIVLIMTLCLLFLGTILNLIFEYNHALKDLPLSDKIMVSFFNSVTLRTAGFYMVDNGTFLNITKMIGIGLMFIGGSPGSTAGGIKTTTCFLLILSIHKQLKGEDNIHIFNKHIERKLIIKSICIFMVYFIMTTTALMILSLITDLALIDLLYEITSAIATVGLTAGITTSLGLWGKIVIILMMYIGRVGPVTILSSFYKTSDNSKNVKYPKANILVG